MTQTNVNVQMQIRRDTAANWASTNPVLLAGEWGYITDTGKFKIGDGSTSFTFLDEAVLSTKGGVLTDHLEISNQKELRLTDAVSGTGGEHYSSFKAGSQSANINYTLPTTAPSDNQYLKCSAAGVLSWDTFTGTDIADLLSNDGDNRILTATGTTNSFNAEANLIFDGSRLLIGTTTEGHGNADDLTIATSGNTGITIRSGATNGGNIFFSDATSGSGEYAGMISYDHNTNDMTFHTTEGSERFRIDSSGQVGIGLTSPSGPLHVYKSSGTSRSYYESGDGHTFIRLLGGSASHNSGLEFFSGSSANKANITAMGTGNLHFDVGSLSPAVYMKPTGNVEIADGNLEIASGHGINFHNYGTGTNISSNLLADYEVGTWTPTVLGGITLTQSAGRYVKIGSMVYATWRITLPTSSDTTHIIINNLPFTTIDLSPPNSGTAKDYSTFDIQDGPMYHIPQNNNQIQFYRDNGAVFTHAHGSGLQFRACSIYQAAS